MSQRTNANGHNVMDVVVFGDNRTERLSIVWWMNRDGSHKYAEVFWNGEHTAAPSYTAKNGAWCVQLPSSTGEVKLCID